MKISRDSTEELLQAILRGAAKILGCNSTNLVLFNEHTGEIRIKIGAMAVSYPVLESIEGVLGKSLSSITLPIERARHSMVYRCWREREIRETSSLSDLAADTFGAVTEQVAALAGPHRFICVPALSGSRNYGVLLFTKIGTHPFSTQQREVLLRYARRIGEIIESNLTGQPQTWLEGERLIGPEYILLDAEGRLIGGAARAADAAPARPSAEALAAIAVRARRLIAEAVTGSTVHELEGRHEARLVRLTLEGREVVLCELSEPHRQAATSLEHQLLQLSLADPAPALFVDPGFRITSCNPASEQLFGCSRGELVGRPVAELFRAPEQILEILTLQALDPATPYSEDAVTALRKDGSFAPARLEALHLADGMRQAVGFLVVVRESDVTEQGSADRLLVQARLATMGELATQLAHEIRNPLLAIGATLNFLGDEAADEEQRRILSRLSREIGRLDMTLKDYLAPRHGLAFAQVALEEVVAEASRLLDDAQRRTGKVIRAEVAPGLTVWGDHDALRHVCFNLLLNALEVTPERAPVRCRADSDASGVTVVVEDSGPGLSALPERCFQPFFTTKKHGSGLGLAVCHKIVRSHGGMMRLANRDGGGCQATVLLPHRAGAEQ